MRTSIEVADDLATGLLPAGLLVVHDAVRSGHHDVAEETRGEQAVDPLLNAWGEEEGERWGEVSGGG